MHFSFVFIPAVLALSVASSPIKSADRTAISLSKRISPANADGTVNVDILRSDREFSMRKISNGLDAFERNTGSLHPLARHRIQKRDTGTVSLTSSGAIWYGTISIGNLPQDFTVDFDTGSSDLFMSGVGCTNSCTGHKSFNTSTSSTAVDLGKTFKLAYADGSSVSGEQYNDTVTIANMQVTFQTLGVADTYSAGFAYNKFHADGLMGMGFRSISSYGALPVFQTMYSQGQVDSPIFAFKLAETGSELSLGAVNPALYTGDFTYTNVTREGYWEVIMDSVAIDGTSALSGVTAAIDTGSTLVYGPTTDIQTFYRKIPGSKDASSTVGDGFWTVPCDAIPTVTLTFGGSPWAISPSLFNRGRVSSGSSDCVGGIAAITGYDFWIVGDMFLQNVYSVFNVDVANVGFAALA